MAEIDLTNKTILFCNITENGLTTSTNPEMQYQRCILNSNNRKIIAQEIDSNIIHSFSPVTNTGCFIEISNYDDHFYVDDMSGSVVVASIDSVDKSINFYLLDKDLTQLQSSSLDISDNQEFSSITYFDISDVTAEGKKVIMQDSSQTTRSILYFDMDNPSNARSYNSNYKTATAQFLSSGAVMLPGYDSSNGNEVINFRDGGMGIVTNLNTNGYYQVVDGENNFILYNDTNGQLVMYSKDIGPLKQITSDSTADIRTNSFNGGLWAEVEDLDASSHVIAISPDQRYEVILENYTEYIFTDATSNSELFEVSLPSDVDIYDDLVTLAIKDETLAALITRASMYYEFNPQTGEIIRKEKVNIPDVPTINTAQLIVDFENARMSLIYKTSNFTYAGGLFSTNTFSQLANYGDRYKMKADLTCNNVYYYDYLFDKYIVLEIPNNDELFDLIETINNGRELTKDELMQFGIS